MNSCSLVVVVTLFRVVDVIELQSPKCHIQNYCICVLLIILYIVVICVQVTRTQKVPKLITFNSNIGESGSQLKFVLEASFKPLIPKSNRSLIMINQNPVHTKLIS